MAISPLSDIVMDVVKAADPAAAEAARARLAAGAPAAGDQVFSVNEPPPAAIPRTEAGGEKKPLQKFEAMVLQNFVQSMLPKSSESFGGGMAGDMWKGLLAEKVADVMAERGGIGIADRLLADHYLADGKPVPIGPAAAAPSQAGAGQAMLSSALVEEFQRKALGALSAEAAPNG